MEVEGGARDMAVGSDDTSEEGVTPPLLDRGEKVLPLGQGNKGERPEQALVGTHPGRLSLIHI